MSAITLKKIPDDIHREIKRLKIDREEKGEKISLEDLYIELIKKALEKK